MNAYLYNADLALCRRALVAAVMLHALLSAGCADQGTKLEFPAELPLTMTNESQFDLLEVRFHPTPTHVGEANQLADGEVIADGQSRSFETFPNFHYVTVVRRRIAGGERIALTTSQPLELVAGTHELLVFQESFRLISAPAGDGGPAPDGGDPLVGGD